MNKLNLQLLLILFMAIPAYGNYAFQAPQNAANGSTFTGENFTQLRPNTKIFEGVSGLRFVSCNLVNCAIPADATTEGCLHIQINFCTHLHPDMIERGLVECIDECEHMTGKEEIVVDGVLIDTVYTWEDIQE